MLRDALLHMIQLAACGQEQGEGEGGVEYVVWGVAAHDTAGRMWAGAGRTVAAYSGRPRQWVIK